MLKDWFVSLDAVSKSVSRIVFVSTLLSFSISSAFSEETGEALLSLPLVELKVVQRNAAGDQYQIGDRIPVFAELKNELIQGQTTFSVKPPEGGSKIEDQGWYVDPQTLLVSNNLQFVVSPIQTGKLILPTLLILREDKTPVARTAPFAIQVNGPQKNQNAQTELLSPIEVSLALKYWFYLGGGVLIAAILITYLARKYFRHRLQSKPIVLPTVKQEPEHVVALQALDSLYKKHPYSTENLKPVAFGISEILKNFFSDRFRIDATEATTDEMLALLRKETLSPDQIRDIQGLFLDLDLIKFTRHNSYSFGEQSYHEFKVKAQGLIQKWANASTGETSGDRRQ